MPNLSTIISGTAFGDITGTGSSTDNAIARWDGTSGKLIQDSSVTIDDSNNLEAPGTIESTSGGFIFPDGSTQTKSAGHGLSAMIALGMAY